MAEESDKEDEDISEFLQYRNKGILLINLLTNSTLILLVPILNFASTDILVQWETIAPDFPILSQIARNILAVPISSTGVERLFSKAALLHAAKPWSPIVFRATVLLHEYDKRRAASEVIDSIYQLDLQEAEYLSTEDIDWEIEVRKDNLKSKSWVNPEWEQLSDDENDVTMESEVITF